MGNAILVDLPVATTFSTMRREGVDLCRASGVLRRQSQALITAAHEALYRAGQAVADSDRVKARCAACTGLRRSRARRP